MLMILIFSLIIMISSTEWLMIWMGMEMNLLSFLSLEKSHNFFSCEFEFKYFFIQFIGSMSFLLSFLFNNKFMFCFSMMIKLLMIPFIYWILSCLMWMNNKMFFILLTIQKIGPLMIVKNMWFFYCYSFYMILYIVMNLFLSLFFILNKTSIKLVLSFSSIIQISLMMLLLNLSKAVYCMYMIIYILSSMILLFFCEKNSTILNMLLFMMIGGFPLFIMFSVKLNLMIVLMNELVNNITMLIVIIAGILFYVYLKMLLINFVKFQSAKLILTKNYDWVLILIFQIMGLTILS